MLFIWLNAVQSEHQKSRNGPVTETWTIGSSKMRRYIKIQSQFTMVLCHSLQFRIWKKNCIIILLFKNESHSILLIGKKKKIRAKHCSLFIFYIRSFASEWDRAEVPSTAAMKSTVCASTSTYKWWIGCSDHPSSMASSSWSAWVPRVRPPLILYCWPILRIGHQFSKSR